MLSYMDLSNLHRLMEYLGIACATILIKISRPALNMNFSFHLITRFVIFSWRSLKVNTFEYTKYFKFNGKLCTLDVQIVWI